MTIVVSAKLCEYRRKSYIAKRFFQLPYICCRRKYGSNCKL